MPTWLKYSLAVITLLGLGVAIGQWAAPSKVVEKEKIVYQDKIVEKKIFVKDKSQHNNKVTITFTTIKPDGTKTIETKTFDKTEIEITQNNTIDKDENKTGETDKEKTVEYKKQDWMLGAGAKVNFDNLSPSYGILVSRRIIGPVYLGAFGFLDKNFGASLSLGF